MSLSNFLPSSGTAKQIVGLATAFATGAALSHIYTVSRIQQRIDSNDQSLSRDRQLPPTALLAAVELGGTSCRVAVAYADDPTTTVDLVEVPTIDPNSTVRAIATFLRGHVSFVALGIASFGPIDLDKSSSTYGFITTTVKPGWQNFNLLGAFSEFHVPIGFDTDVNAPALAELKYGGHENVDSCAYITVGTGVGVGVVVDGNPVHGLAHPEGGHIMVLRKSDDQYPGWSHIHRESVESMASARACAERIGVDPSELASAADDHPAWEDIAYYLAQACITITYIASPQVIVLSGGVLKRTILFEKIRKHFEILNDGYIGVEKLRNNLDKFIVPSAYGNQIGIIGALELARRAGARIA